MGVGGSAGLLFLRIKPSFTIEIIRSAETEFVNAENLQIKRKVNSWPNSQTRACWGNCWWSGWSWLPLQDAAWPSAVISQQSLLDTRLPAAGPSSRSRHCWPSVGLYWPPSKFDWHTTQRETLTWSDQCQSIKTRSNLDIRRMNKGTLIIPSQLKLVKMYRKVCSNQPQHANILKRSTNIRPNSPKNLENLPESILSCWSE